LLVVEEVRLVTFSSMVAEVVLVDIDLDPQHFPQLKSQLQLVVAEQRTQTEVLVD
tara:strand:- start:571 stop:735 length:165 start_codon:yes stop_codon:yes gene_type:complete